ncbi:iron-sulfur cluster assembly scaffold protein [Ectothiorhodospiraceae bacterium WFHF3C12]|nr:iron-sulfur cluster assembly scaffold protein [Ectothiorhodospiraceae bacterium WFHF3C12]
MTLESMLSRSGALEPEADKVTGRAGAVDRGTVVEVHLCIRGGVVEEARFLAFGAPEAFACAAAACEALTGGSLANVGALSGLAIAQRAGIDRQALAHALVVEDALQSALAEVQR